MRSFVDQGAYCVALNVSKFTEYEIRNTEYESGAADNRHRDESPLRGRGCVRAWIASCLVLAQPGGDTIEVISKRPGIVPGRNFQLLG